MGDPRRLTKKYSGPKHPWRANRIAEESQLVIEYGLKNKTEIWKASSELTHMQQQAKKLTASRGKQSEKETAQFMERLSRIALAKEGRKLVDVLSLTTKDILERRLQTQLVRKGMAKTMDQARQFIIHGHVTVKGKKVTRPSYQVTVIEESMIGFVPTSAVASADHPARQIEVKKK